MNYKFILTEIFSVVLFSYIVFKYFGLTINTFVLNSTDYTFDIRYSSVWCLGSKLSERRCRFTNLCFKKDTNDFVFLSDDLSIKAGLPLDRFSPALVELSSVSDHNQYYFNFVEIPFNSLKNLSKIYKIESLKGKTFIMSRFKPDNLMHYFHDDVIPLYFTLKQIGSKQIDSIFLFDKYMQSFHKPFDRNIFENIFPKSFTTNELHENTIYCMEESVVGLSKSSTFYDYGFRKPQTFINRSEEETELISKTIRKFNKEVISDPKCVTNHIIFISRQMNRKILNEEILIQFISNFSKLKVIRIENFENNFEDIIEKVFCSQLLIGIHGSGLMLSQFLKPGSSLIELFPYAINPDYVTPYRTLTQLKGMGVHYFYWKNLLSNNSFTHSEYPKEFGGIQDLNEEQRNAILSNNDDVPQHLCCDNPYWLYRIYSDSIVDISSFAPVLERALNQSSEPLIIETRNIEPGVVMNLSCEKIEVNDELFVTIVWEKPWNLEYMENHLKVNYEVLLQDVDSNTAKSSILSGNQLSFVSKANKTYNIWIRCKSNDIFGPFNTNPVIC